MIINTGLVKHCKQGCECRKNAQWTLSVE
ncbi:hypothetical protein JMJ77_0010992 [Colletotrichum scovillei]|uniref:Uncharacterized protein n=1 Tax=Colletotrichum scovillei TaxID=1209932 RepID=A0A9P7R2W8_9PEZI|nr:hypothetical protein JMJ77_0010992 [Colletotrichum scovillei]KAG7059959.1 hypothetical protein JMJ78_0015243 [Colletotrichum scovillei]KAG7067411.1 hypothetical protein JMJ76_0008848 [Colletotrichum scovillei]